MLTEQLQQQPTFDSAQLSHHKVLAGTLTDTDERSALLYHFHNVTTMNNRYYDTTVTRDCQPNTTRRYGLVLVFLGVLRLLQRELLPRLQQLGRRVLPHRLQTAGSSIVCISSYLVSQSHLRGLLWLLLELLQDALSHLF